MQRIITTKSLNQNKMVPVAIDAYTEFNLPYTMSNGPTAAANAATVITVFFVASSKLANLLTASAIDLINGVITGKSILPKSAPKTVIVTGKQFYYRQLNLRSSRLRVWLLLQYKQFCWCRQLD